MQTMRDKLEGWLQASQFTRSDLARFCNVNPSTVTHWLRDVVPTPKRAKAIEKFTGGAVPAAGWIPKKRGQR